MHNGVTRSEGIFIGIKEAGKPISLTAETMPIAPGTSTYIGLTEKTVSRLPAPYKSNCTYRQPEDMNEGLPIQQAYSGTFCKAICYRMLFEKHCNCTLPELVTGDLNFLTRKQEYPYCSQSFTSEDMACLLRTLSANAGQDGLETALPCRECQPECKERTYQVKYY